MSRQCSAKLGVSNSALVGIPKVQGNGSEFWQWLETSIFKNCNWLLRYAWICGFTQWKGDFLRCLYLRLVKIQYPHCNWVLRDSSIGTYQILSSCHHWKIWWASIRKGLQPASWLGFHFDFIKTHQRLYHPPQRNIETCNTGQGLNNAMVRNLNLWMTGRWYPFALIVI